MADLNDGESPDLSAVGLADAATPDLSNGPQSAILANESYNPVLSKNEGWLSIGSMADQDQDSNGRAIHLPYKEAKARFEKEYIREMLEEYDGNITRTAENMGLSRRQLFNKITEYGIDAESYKDENKK